MFDNTIAMREGWAISSCSGTENGDIWRLERLDEVGIFENDADAWKHVWHLAINGSLYHTDALNFLYENQRNEYNLIASHDKGE